MRRTYDSHEICTAHGTALMQDDVPSASTSRTQLQPLPVGQDVAHTAHAQVPDLFGRDHMFSNFDAFDALDTSMFAPGDGLEGFDFGPDFGEWFSDPKIITTDRM